MAACISITLNIVKITDTRLSRRINVETAPMITKQMWKYKRISGLFRLCIQPVNTSLYYAPKIPAVLLLPRPVQMNWVSKESRLIKEKS
jgi:hypothetical protein